MSSPIPIILPGQIKRELTIAGDLWPMRAAELVIDSQATINEATALLRDIKLLDTEIHKSCDPVCTSTNAAHKAATFQRSTLLAPLAEAAKVIKQKAATFLHAQAQEQRRLEAEAEAKQRKIEEEAELQAASLREQGEEEIAQSVLEEAEAAPPIIATPVAQAPVGVSTRKNWKTKVTSLRELIVYVASVEDGSMDRLLTENTKALNAMAKGLESDLKIPGVESYNDVGLSLR